MCHSSTRYFTVKVKILIIEPDKDENGITHVPISTWFSVFSFG